MDAIVAVALYAADWAGDDWGSKVVVVESAVGVEAAGSSVVAQVQVVVVGVVPPDR